MSALLELRLREYCSKRNDFLVVFLFGSFAKGLETAESDVDLAILFRTVPDFSELCEIREELADITARNVDIVVLNDASPIISRQVLKYGVMLKKTPKIYSEFFTRIVMAYDDLKYCRREIEEKILRGRLYD